MFSKTLKVTTFATVIAASVTVPAMVMTVEAASVSIVDVVVEKEGKFYKIDVKTYNNLKAAEHSLLKEINLEHVYSSNGKIYPVKTYNNAKAAGGNMAGAFEILEREGLEVDLTTGKIEFNGSKPEFIEDEDAVVEDLKVLSIE